MDRSRRPARPETPPADPPPLIIDQGSPRPVCDHCGDGYGALHVNPFTGGWRHAHGCPLPRRPAPAVSPGGDVRVYPKTPRVAGPDPRYRQSAPPPAGPLPAIPTGHDFPDEGV